MAEPRPIEVSRKDGVLVPRLRGVFDIIFVEGQSYTIEVHVPRSTKSHDHFHAAVREAWRNLPEGMAERFVDADHLRKFALIKAGWAKESTVVCANENAAIELAAIVGRIDGAAIVTVFGTVVTIATAKSQRMTGPDAMNKDDFQKSKQDVLDYVAALIGVDAATLSSQVSNSSGDSEARTDSAPAGIGPQPPTSPAGASNFEEASLLSDDWKDSYIATMTGPTTRAMSILTRHTTGLQMLGGQPNDAELKWMRAVAQLATWRDKGRLQPGEFDAELAKLKDAPLSSITTNDAA